jgi:hypothetical protein
VSATPTPVEKTNPPPLLRAVPISNATAVSAARAGSASAVARLTVSRNGADASIEKKREGGGVSQGVHRCSKILLIFFIKSFTCY